MIKCGRFEIYSIINGHIRLDGGAMFGVVPKVLWARKQDVDDQNRILLATRSLLAIDGDRVILVDTGCGSKWEKDAAERFGVEPDAEAIPRALGAIGFSEDSVTDVVVTHLHFDHNGGLTLRDATTGNLRPRYAGARHWIHEEHWAHANAPTLKDRASFLPDDFQSLESNVELIRLSGPKPDSTINGIEWVVANGHTRAQLLPLFEDREHPLLFVGDVIPTSAHLPPAWVMAYDLAPLTTIDEKLGFYLRARRDGMFLAFPHDPEHAAIALDPGVDKPIIASVLDLS